jgi:transcriptional regulator of acetoin/glycerol metabolism
VTLKEALRDAGRAYLYRVLSEAGGNMAKAAKIAGVHRVTFYRTCEKYGLKVENRKYVRRTDLT